MVLNANWKNSTPYTPHPTPSLHAKDAVKSQVVTSKGTFQGNV